MALPTDPIIPEQQDYTYNDVVYTYDPVTYEPIPAQGPDPTTGPIFTFKNKLGRFPGNNKQWWVAKADADDPDAKIKAGDFLPELLQTFYSGNNRAPRGHYILNQFRKDRSAVSGVSNLPVEELGERPNAITFFSGRAWYAAGSTVYYSQILDTTTASKAGLCYQEADPTAEDISDLIASDGGMVPIPEADRIEAMTPVGNGVMIFAQNGVWFISGGDSAFSALNISVSKVSPIGTKSPLSIVETSGIVFWWSELGIQAIQQSSGQFASISGQFGNTNIAEQTIQTFYNKISDTAKQYVKGVLDARNNVVYWLYSSDGTAFEYDSVLIYDITLQAFYPWKFSSIAEGPKVNGLFVDTGYLSSSYEQATTTNTNAPVTNAAGAPVTVAGADLSIRPSALYYLTQVPDKGLTVAAPVNMNYVDWEAYDTVGADYDSFILTGFELNNDAMRDKQILYLFAHLKRTEDDFGNNPSSCKLITQWDWGGEDKRRWSREVEVYRPRTLNLTDVVVSKNKVRGHGKAVQFRFGTNERGKTFDLLGWSVGYTGNTQP